MKLFYKIKKKLPNTIDISPDNIDMWPKWKKLLEENKIIFDGNNKLRYLHGAPVGAQILIRVNKEGVPIYKESTEEWFDPDSPKALEFKWPK